MPERIADRLYNWASILEDKTREQALKTASMPFIFPHVALMPDAHLGKGATVGSVIPTLGAIIPAAVGVDIGCGMMAVRTQWKAHQLPNSLRDIREDIERSIPLSAGNYNKAFWSSATEARVRNLEQTMGIETAEKLSPQWYYQLGSLGSGNHFIEISLDENDDVWLFLHSGSRGVGNKIAQKYIEIAVKQCKQRWVSLPDPDLAYLVEGEPEFWAYMQGLRWAQRFAYLNREEMMDRVIAAVSSAMGRPVEAQETINCHHNYTERETHFGREVWLSRKGAINAASGVPGLIPGSMGDASYVVVGKGNPVALNSSPHGAGRNYSRGEAKRTFTIDDLRERMQGIEWRDSDVFLDEHPLAYKPIDQVMADSADLVEIKHTLRQVLNVKGD
jgi:tRNA-splicing ligase RtcB